MTTTWLNIKIVYHDYVHPVYRQQSQPFEPFMSTLDLIMNYGEKSLDVIMNRNMSEIS